MEERLSRGVGVVSARLSSGVGEGSATLAARLSGGGDRPSFSGDAGVAYPFGGFLAEAGLELGNWTGFSATSWRAALAYSDTVVVPFTLRGFAGAGDRGIPDPVLDTAQAIGFDAVGLGGTARLGPFDVSGRYTLQALDHELGLTASWDRAAMLDSIDVDMSTWEVRVEGALIPLGGIIDGLSPIRLESYYRTNSTSRARLPVYVPDTSLRAGLTFQDTFFQDNLTVWLNIFFERRGTRAVPVAGDPNLIIGDAYTWPGGMLMFKIGDFRFFYRLENPTGATVADIPGAVFPLRVGVFGIRWEFFN